MNILPAMATREGFLTYLAEREIMTAGDVERLKRASARTGHSFDTIVTELGLMRDTELAEHLAEYTGSGFAESADHIDVDMDLEWAKYDFFDENAILPVRQTDASVSVVIADPFSADTLEAISFWFEKSPDLTIAPRTAIRDRINVLRAANDPEDKSFIAIGADGVEEADIRRLEDSAKEAPIIQSVNRIIQQAVDQKATDIHIEPTEKSVRIRMRRDGILSVSETAPLTQASGITTRIKILSNLNISERRRPQDGRMRLSVRGQEIDFRVSIVPCVHGETIVLRVLDRSSVVLDLGTLGFDRNAAIALERFANFPNGIVLVTGPTGSGKTTTLYSLLSLVNKPSVKIFTVEDPVEYRMDGITQLQIDTAIDVTFANALRAVLRQDPDIILVGEIRDAETAQIALQAALTGHLVLSTLHTNSAAGAITRLRDMGIEDYLLSATLRGVVGQRLLRILCRDCGGAACDACRQQRYRGRTVAYELGFINRTVADRIGAGKNEAELQQAFRSTGMVPMKDHGMSLVKNNITDLVEYARVLEMDAD